MQNESSVSKIKAVVFKEHTLGILWENPNGNDTIEVLRAIVNRGATFSVYNDPFMVYDENDWRMAKEEDFEVYRVQLSSNLIIDRTPKH